ncbi:MAG: GAF domain-containing protein [Anaerolineales bacterium]|nr:GAF domain-containing protein [Anaerolineales bacterium]
MKNSQDKSKLFRLADVLEPQDIRTILIQAATFMVVLVLFSGVIYLINREEIWANFLRNSIVALGICLILIQLIKANQTILAAYLTLSLFGTWLLSVAWGGAGVQGPAYTLLVLVVIGSGLFIGRHAGYMAALLFSLAGVGLVIAGRAGLLTNIDRPITDISVLLITTLVFFISAYMIRISVDQVERALAKAQKQVEERIAAEDETRRLNQDLEKRVLERTRELTASQEKYRSRADEMSLLYKLSNSLAAGQDLYSTLHALQDEIIHLFAVDAFYVAIYNHETDIVNYPIFFYEGAPLESASRRLSTRPGLTGAVIFEGKTIYLPDMTLQESGDKYAAVNDNNLILRTFLGVPLISKERIIGILSVQSKQVNAFSSDQIQLMENIAVQAALTIDKATLFDQLQFELAERKRLITELENKNAELERFTYTVSHELKSPIVTIKAFLGSVERDIRENKLETVYKDFRRISKATDNLYKTLSDLLELSRLGHTVNPLEPVDLGVIAREAAEVINARIQAKNVEIHISPSLPTVHGDRLRLREVFENLIDNASKYTGSQSSPRIEIGVHEGVQPTVFVRDNGLGIDPKYRETIFGLFNKLDNQSEGTGVGLAIVKRIIETHGGKIWVESEGPGKGATFLFTLPSDKG